MGMESADTNKMSQVGHIVGTLGLVVEVNIL